MELYVVVAGKGQEQWKNELHAIKVPYKSAKGMKLSRVGVAEVKMYKVYFPADQLDNVMSVVGVPAGAENYPTKKNPQLNWFIKQLRKFLKLICLGHKQRLGIQN